MEIDYKKHTDTEIEEIIMEGFSKLKVDTLGVPDAFDRATFFSQILVALSGKIREYTVLASIAKADMSREKSNAYQRAEGAVTARKELVASDVKYYLAQVAYGEADAELKRLNSLHDTFRDAHVLFRRVVTE